MIKKEEKLDVKPNAIKEQLMIFLDSTIENQPSIVKQRLFEYNLSKFGSSCDVSDKLIQQN